jgi:site-specific DNA recombinase
LPSTTGGDESPEGELTDGILDQLAEFERAKIAERSRRGKLRKAREGKIMVTMKPPHGFRYNATRDGLVAHPPEMDVVERIFRMAAEGLGTAAIQTRLYREKVPAPLGGEVWHRTVIRWTQTRSTVSGGRTAKLRRPAKSRRRLARDDAIESV